MLELPSMSLLSFKARRYWHGVTVGRMKCRLNVESRRWTSEPPNCCSRKAKRACAVHSQHLWINCVRKIPKKSLTNDARSMVAMSRAMASLNWSDSAKKPMKDWMQESENLRLLCSLKLKQIWDLSLELSWESECHGSIEVSQSRQENYKSPYIHICP